MWKLWRGDSWGPSGLWLAPVTGGAALALYAAAGAAAGMLLISQRIFNLLTSEYEFIFVLAHLGRFPILFREVQSSMHVSCFAETMFE